MLWSVGSQNAAHIKVFLLRIKTMWEAVPFQHGLFVSSFVSACPFWCQNYKSLKRNELALKKKKVWRCQEAVKLSILPHVMTPSRLYGNLGDIIPTTLFCLCPERYKDKKTSWYPLIPWISLFHWLSSCKNGTKMQNVLIGCGTVVLCRLPCSTVIEWCSGLMTSGRA